MDQALGDADAWHVPNRRPAVFRRRPTSVRASMARRHFLRKFVPGARSQGQSESDSGSKYANAAAAPREA